MVISNVQATFPCNVNTLWNIVTDLTDWSWRSDLSKIEVLSQTQFVEHTKSGYATVFTITKTDPYKCWEFDMENENMSGHWVGVFSFDGKNTVIDFTENVTAKKLLMKPFVKRYLQKQQSLYVEDLQRAIALRNLLV